jgi:hypothetical protein
VQILHPFLGSVQQYFDEIADPDRHRPDHCAQCNAGCPLTALGFYSRTLMDTGFDGSIPVRRYPCRSCKRTVSLLPEFALPYLRFGIASVLTGMPYRRGQFWVRRFRRQAERLSVSLAAKVAPPPATDFVSRSLHMLECIGWIVAHRFLFAELRVHLLG